jgi:putative heme-binding domain-containing protein
MAFSLARAHAAAFVILSVLPPALRGQVGTADLARGQQIFEAQCARCHGIGGTGGLGADLRRPKLRRAPDDTALFDLIKGGILDRGMPDAWQLSDNEVRLVAAYVRTLGKVAETPVPGDPQKGRELFRTKGGCPVCHMVSGQGGSFGPDLTEVGALRGPVFLREALVNPGASLPVGPATGYPWGEYARYLQVLAIPTSGDAVLGVRVNEDAFTIQVRDPAGKLHSLRKADLRQLDKQFGKSMMPAYKGVFNDRELQDLVAYLSSLRGTP